MASKIINMVEKLKDEADQKLESLFRSEPVRDDGFSVNIVKRVRRQIWVQRLSLPVAIGLGVLVAAKPLSQLLASMPKLLAVVPASFAALDSVSVVNLPDASTIIPGLMLLAVAMMFSRILED